MQFSETPTESPTMQPTQVPSLASQGQSTQSCAIPLDVFLVLDGSGSVSEEQWLDVVAASKSLVQLLRISEDGNHLSVVQFANAANLEISLSGNAKKVSRALDKMVQKQTSFKCLEKW